MYSMYPTYYSLGFDIGYILLMISALAIGGVARFYINRTYKYWSAVPVSTGESGADVARRMLRDLGALDVSITSVEGSLTDFYDPRDNALHLSKENRAGGSVASIAVACHEAGHAVQTNCGYVPIKVRTALVPVVNFCSQIWLFVLIAGMMFHLVNLAMFAVVLFSSSVLFHIVTLPVEIDASRRAITYIERSGSFDAVAVRGARQVLTAAALTYVAAALVSVMQLVYYLLMSRRDD